MTNINMERLALLRDRIAEVGDEHCEMANWASGTLRAEGEPECETTGCIAGWASAIALGKVIEVRRQQGAYYFITYVDPSGETVEPHDTAMEWLGLTSSQAAVLFHDDEWPVKYAMTLLRESSAKGMLSLLDALLDGSVVLGEQGIWWSRDGGILETVCSDD